MNPAGSLAELVIVGYHDYRRRFGGITRRAWRRFEDQDWEAGQEDARERILLYDVVLAETIGNVRRRFAGGPPPGPAALDARRVFAEWARGRTDAALTETFYNSVVRRLYGTVGVDPETEFVTVADDVSAPPPNRHLSSFALAHGFAPALDAVLESLPFNVRWNDRRIRVQRAAHLLARELGPEAPWRDGVFEVLRPPFFRNKAAYVVGRCLRDRASVPLILALTHPPGGIVLDAVLPTADEVSVVFGFSRSYLHVDTPSPVPIVEYLRAMLPHKRVDELYTAIGFNRHGKTEFYRALLRHLGDPAVRFRPTPGRKGLVMIVFTLDGLNVVFKVIRDRFAPPKRSSREQVKRSYAFIFAGDRVGRLADAQQFERLELPRDRFESVVVNELAEAAPRGVSVRGETLIIEHLYTQRRVHPLDVYLPQADPAEAVRATLDFGQAIKDLAAGDIFPGDMLVKNFGVTRHGRVIFYDYDEVAVLTDCRFRDLPRAPYPEAELADEPPFHAGPLDVFPAAWRPFLGPPGPLRHALQQAHPELLDPAWWRAMQRRHRSGEIVDFFPYPAERRLGD